MWKTHERALGLRIFAIVKREKGISLQAYRRERRRLQFLKGHTDMSYTFSSSPYHLGNTSHIVRFLVLCRLMNIDLATLLVALSYRSQQPREFSSFCSQQEVVRHSTAHVGYNLDWRAYTDCVTTLLFSWYQCFRIRQTLKSRSRLNMSWLLERLIRT